MFCSLRKISFVFVALFLLNIQARAGGTSKFEGIVKDPRGHAIKDAEVRVEAKNETIIAKGKTDANGHYVTSALPAGIYKVDLVINSVTNSSVPSVKTNSNGATHLDFAVKADPPKKGGSPTHRTGSNLW
jgi:uncharacterized protein YfaS (alpha-2-macroglobulin family)